VLLVSIQRRVGDTDDVPLLLFLLLLVVMCPLQVPYWFVKVGPVVDGSYEYVVATDDKSQMLFVLARDVKTFETKYEKEVKKWVEDQGFMGPRFGPVKSDHSATCQYSTAPPKPIKANKPNLRAEPTEAAAAKDEQN